MKATCEYIHKPDGWRCQTVPRRGTRCCLHRGKVSAQKCRFFEKCGRWYSGTRGVCARCQCRRWRLLRKEKAIELAQREMDEYVSLLLEEIFAEI